MYSNKGKLNDNLGNPKDHIDVLEKLVFTKLNVKDVMQFTLDKPDVTPQH
jgi:hypothetical protein